MSSPPPQPLLVASPCTNPWEGMGASPRFWGDILASLFGEMTILDFHASLWTGRGDRRKTTSDVTGTDRLPSASLLSKLSQDETAAAIAALEFAGASSEGFSKTFWSLLVCISIAWVLLRCHHHVPNSHPLNVLDQFNSHEKSPPGPQGSSKRCSSPPKNTVQKLYHFQ